MNMFENQISVNRKTELIRTTLISFQSCNQRGLDIDKVL